VGLRRSSFPFNKDPKIILHYFVCIFAGEILMPSKIVVQADFPGFFFHLLLYFWSEGFGWSRPQAAPFHPGARPVGARIFGRMMMMGSTFLRAEALMTMAVVTVPDSMPVASLAGLLADRGISSVPVTDAEGKLLGIVTEADLLRRLAGIEDIPSAWLRRLIDRPDAQAKHYARTHGLLARDVMTTPVISVEPEATAEHCAALMERHGIKRLPVLHDGVLVGVISRADLLRAVSAPSAQGNTTDDLSDARTAAAVRKAMRDQPWSGSLYTFVSVTDGVATLDGFVREDIRRGLTVLVSGVPGVRRVEDHMEKAPIILAGELI
jgi:CBS domain-containing protein